jgi:hypothetical protein
MAKQVPTEYALATGPVAGASTSPLAVLDPGAIREQFRGIISHPVVCEVCIVLFAAIGAGIGARYWREGGAAIGAVLGVSLARAVFEEIQR